MIVNERKIKFMIINGGSGEKSSLSVQNMNIGYSNHYVYLGGYFTDDGKMTSVIKYHAVDCETSEQVCYFHQSEYQYAIPLEKESLRCCYCIDYIV